MTTRRFAALAWLGLAWLGCTAAQQPTRAERQMVVAANPYASEAGIRILRAGGGAVDAAIAVQLVLSLVEPQSSGIGGGAFLMFFDAGDELFGSGQVIVYQGRETAPATATPALFLDADGRPMSFMDVGFGGLPVGVPAVMRMLEMAHAEHGRLPWAELFAPAIELSEQGFEISPRLYFLLDRFRNLARAEKFKQYFYAPDGEPYVTGHLLKNAEYADTLRLLARDGAGAMYAGPLAEAIVAAVSNNSLSAGQLTLADLDAYRAERVEPLCTPYRSWRVCGPQLPSSGGITVQQTLGMLAAFDLAAAGDDPVQSVHLVAEANRLAFADRDYYLGDPKFINVPVAALLSPAYLRQRAELINPAAALPQVSHGTPDAGLADEFAPSPPSEIASTSHFSIVDRFGDAVAMTTSVQGAFGSQLMVGGFILNNQLTDFSTEPEIDGRPVANGAAGGKRPLSSMSPSLILDARGRLHLLIGSPGGTRIINYVTQAIVGVLDWGRDIQTAVAAPHFVSRGGPLELEERSGLLEQADDLRRLGHEVVERNLNSGLHGIVIDYSATGRVLWGGVDPRREGLAIGD